MCAVHGCSGAEAPRRGPFCRWHAREVTDEEWWALRMASNSPCFHPRHPTSAWGLIDGSEVVRVSWGQPPEIRWYRGIREASRAMHSVEFWLLAVAIADRILAESVVQVRGGRAPQLAPR